MQLLDSASGPGPRSFVKGPFDEFKPYKDKVDKVEENKAVKINII
jgi:hypothetical protein